MSVDLYLDDPDDPEEGYSVNVTYNLGPMWFEASGRKGRTFELDGMTGREAIPLLTTCLAAVDTAPQVFHDLEPENGWGNVEWFRRALETCLEASREYPDSRWRAWR